MKPNLSRLWLPALGTLLFAGSGLAQTLPSLENDFRNILSQQPANAWPPPPPSILVDPRIPTANQFKSGTVLGGWQTARIYRRGISIPNSDFELPALGEGAFSDVPPAATASWTFGGSSGVARGGTWFAPAAVAGVQGAFLKNTGSISQTLTVPAGTYQIRFKAVARQQTPSNSVSVFFNNVLIQTFADTGFSPTEWRQYATGNVVVSAAGAFTLRFAGLSNTDDRATIVDDIAMVVVDSPVTIPNSSFELPALAPDQELGFLGPPVSAATASWTFEGVGGITRTTFWYLPAPPAGVQAAFLYHTTSISQSISVPAGTYRIRFKAVGASGRSVGQGPQLNNGLSVSFNNVLLRTYADTEFSASEWKEYTVTPDVVVPTAGNFTLRFTGVPGALSRVYVTSVDDITMVAVQPQSEILAGGLTKVAGTTTLRLPRGFPTDANGNVLSGQGAQLDYVRMSTPLTARQVAFSLGAQIAAPAFTAGGRPLASTEINSFYLPEPQNSATGRFYYSPHAQKVFATQPGVVDVVWVERASGATFSRQYVIAASPVKPVRKMFWTENGFNGPIIQIPASRVSTVNVVYNSLFPATVATAYVRPGEVVDPNVSLPPEKRTLWFSTLDNALHAYNAEGRVFIELLGALKSDGVSREFLGYEIVEVAKETRSSTERIHIGDELLPINNESALVARVVAGVTNVDGQGAFLHQHFNQGTSTSRLFAIRKTTPLFSAGVELPSNEVLLYWLDPGDLGLLWPKYYAGYIFDWPADKALFSVYARSGDPSAATAIQLNSADSPSLVYQDDPSRLHASLTNNFQFSTTVTTGAPVGRSLIRYTNGNTVWFERVYSQLDTTFPGFTGTPISVDVGQRILPPAGADTHVGYIRQASGTAFNPNAYKDPFVVGFDQALKGAIIGVNALPTNNVLEVWWYKKSAPLAAAIQGTYWPAFVQKYQLKWPTAPAEIVLASNAGSGELSSLPAKGSIYFQNNSALPGYNPNEEHALMLNGRAWALRDDLNLATSSGKYVLVEYTDGDNRPAMVVFAVLREKLVAGLQFHYPAEAGKVLQAPMPLPLLPLPTRPVLTNTWDWLKDYFTSNPKWFPDSKKGQDVANHEVPLATSADAPANATLTDFQVNSDAPRYGQFTFLDRKGTTWVYRGMHSSPANPTATFSMRYFYRTQPGFYFPELATQPEVGTVVPYIRKTVTESPVTGEPLAIKFTPRWPAAVPELRIGETLTRPKYGLPAVRGQTSVELIYQQSIARDAAGALTSATLFDPTRAKTYPLSAATLAKIPDSAATELYLGKRYFTRLPPHLSQRFYLDPNQGALGALVLKGEFKQAALGEDYLLLNILSADDVTALKDLVDAADLDKAWWDIAINGLATTLETFMEDPSKRGTYIVDPTLTTTTTGTAIASIKNDDTAVDSYAISAVGGGSGYVVMAVGNGEAFTPVNEPISLAVFKVMAPLNRGELKIVQASNPLDEKLTLQHSGDLAGSPEGYDFEWRYAPPVDGVPPTLYTYTASLLLGNVAGWRRYDQPGANFADLRLPGPDTAAPISTGVSVTTPFSVTIRDRLDTVDHGTTRPQAVIRKQFDIVSLPLRSFLSVQLGNRDGANIYVNQTLVAIVNRSAATNTPMVSSPGKDFSPLPRLYELPSSLLRTTGNVVTVELYTDADLDVGSIVNVRIEGLAETVNLSGWTLIAKSASETAGITSGSINGKTRHVIQGNSLLTLTDNYFIMRYRARNANNAAFVSGEGWSKWVDPQLAEGWIKRALAGINPFQQRVTDLFSNAVNTDVSLVQQAGRRWEGDIALNLSNISSFGLIEIYETILRRGKGLSIEGSEPINYAPANDALLLAAGYLADLYMIHGNEAYADAANPTIAYGLDNGSTFGDVSTSLFAFKGQLATVLDEELTLLRGRDNILQPGTRVNPVYNRLVWNYTRGIDSGEAIYALNYNIKDLDGDGLVGASDAAKLYPQGHGDGYGHYLTALTGYYGLLANANFTWSPRSEAVTILGKPVQVDYFDERKFAAAAVAVTRTASQIIDLTYRQAYTTANATSWTNLKDGRVTNGITRRWGVDEWATRGGQGAYFHWLTGNSMLPAVDTDPAHEGIQKIDRSTVPELAELVAQGDAIQQSLSNADAHLNPLGLVTGALAFDISPSGVDAGTTHFEQIFTRATTALQNTITAFNNAKTSTQFLRQQEDSLAAARAAITQQEQAYTNRLIELYGTPYPDDIGPGKTFVQDYAGPDLFHYRYADIPEGLITSEAKSYDLLLNPQFNEANPGVVNYNEGQTISFTMDGTGEYRKPSTWAGRRASPGQIQTGVSDVLLARLELYQALEDYSGTKDSMEQSVAIFRSTLTRHSEEVANLEKYQAAFTTIEVIEQALATTQLLLEAVKESAGQAAEALSEAPPKSVGLASDATSAVRSAIKFGIVAVGGGLSASIISAEIGQKITAQTKSSLERVQELEQLNIAWAQEYAQLVYDLRATLGDMVGGQSALDAAIRRYDQAQRNLRALIASGDRLQAERETFRRSSAALIQGYRTKDLGFRAFRDESLEKYKQLLDLSTRYAYLAATAYDYETGLLNPAGSGVAATFMDKIVKSRSPGVMSGGVPQFGGATAGDPGVAGALAQINTDWAVVKSRLGFNNPDRYRTTFSLRGENYRILSTADGDAAWREILLAARRDNLMDDPDAARHCLNLGLTSGLAVPGFIIEFSTTISPGYNFFGQPLAGGDSTFSATSFATKIRASGIAFSGYVGMVGPSSTANATGSIGATTPADPFTAFTEPTALSATPFIYLVPAGADSMRSPLGNGTVIRSWSVVDQAVPLPFNIGGSDFTTAKTWTSARSLTEGYTLRQHQAFRAVPDGTVFSSSPGFTNGRLIGRSVWNSRWKIIIPGETLLADPKRGMQIFIDTVKDIKLHFESYSTAGN